MKKKIIFGTLLILGLICGLCFYLGYTIPQRDKHKEWIFFPENKDADFTIEKTDIKTNLFRMKFPLLKGSLILNEDENEYYIATIVDEQYRKVKTFPKAKAFYLDSANYRILLDESSIDKESRLFGYSLKNFKRSELLTIQKYPIKETLKEFAFRKKYNYYPYESARNEQLIAEYLAEKQQEVAFYKKLSAVVQVSNKYEELNIHCYTDSNGQLLDIEDPLTATDNIHEIWDSLYLLFPNYNKQSTGLLPYKYISLIEADKPSVYSNFFHVGVFFTSQFRQWYIHYYKIKFGDKSFNYKDKDNDDISFEQLNIPKSETDTLYMNCNNYVYRIYLKNNKNH